MEGELIPLLKHSGAEMLCLNTFLIFLSSLSYIFFLLQMAMLLKLQEAANYIESPEKEADPKLPTLWTQIYTEPSRISSCLQWFWQSSEVLMQTPEIYVHAINY